MNETAKPTRSTKRRPPRLTQEQTSPTDKQVKVSGSGAARRKFVRVRGYSKTKLRVGDLKVLQLSRSAGTPAPENFIGLVVIGDAITGGVPVRERTYLRQKYRRIAWPHPRTDSGREVASVLMDNEGLGLRLLSGLRYNRPTSVKGLLSGAKVGVEVFTPTVVRLAEFGLVEVRNTKLTRTARGNSVFRYLESASGMNFKNLFGRKNVTPEEKSTLWGILGSTVGTAAAPAPDPDPPQQEAEGCDEAMKDPNYRKYREEAPWLEREFGCGFVAYAYGKRVAFAEDMNKLLDDVSNLLGKTNVLIQEVPEKVVETSLPFHVLG